MNTSNYRFVLALLGAAVLGAGSAAAMPPGPMPMGVYDTDADGKVSQEEFYRAREARWAARAKEGRMLRNQGKAPTFESMDSNDDGYLNEKELTAGHALHMQQRFAQRPSMRPRPGRTNPAGRRGPPSFSDFDRDGNGVITEQEFQQTRGERHALRAAQGYPMGQSPFTAPIEDRAVRGYGAPMPGGLMPGSHPCRRW